jgi:hypothetical protein
MKILAIDPGANTGCAYFVKGSLESVFTTTPYQIVAFLEGKSYDRVILEDSTLISYVYTAPGVKGAAKLKIARNIGEVDGYCKMIVAACIEAGIPCLQISPKGKGEKLNAAQFKAATSWKSKSNQHERDAAMVGWPYRNVFKI